MSGRLTDILMHGYRGTSTHTHFNTHNAPQAFVCGGDDDVVVSHRRGSDRSMDRCMMTRPHRIFQTSSRNYLKDR